MTSDSSPEPDATATSTDEPAPGTAPRRRRRGGIVRETAILLVVAIVLALVVKTFFAQAFYIPSGSMEPGLVKNDRILVEKPSYWFGGTPQRGDIVVFADPGDWLTAAESGDPGNPATTALSKIGLYPTGGHLVKRVIGVGGDTIHCCTAKTGELEVNGKAIDEHSFLEPQSLCDGPRIPSCNWTAVVPADHLFVMGDNREGSADSSEHLADCRDRTDCPDAYVADDLVVGKAVMLVFPFGRFEILHRPAAFDDIPDPS